MVTTNLIPDVTRMLKIFKGNFETKEISWDEFWKGQFA